MTIPHINRIGSAVPEHDIHAPFVTFGRTLLTDDKSRFVFDRMAERAGIDHRFSVFAAGEPGADRVDVSGFYHRGRFPHHGRSHATVRAARHHAGAARGC